MAVLRSEAPGVLAATRAARRRVRWVGRIPLAGEILIAYLQTRRALATAPINVVLARLRAPPRTRPRPAEDPLAQARHLASAVVRTLALVPGDTRCLARSLVLTRLLARRGIPATLVIGTRTVPDFGAHAWVEYSGRAVLAPGDESFSRLVEL